MSAGEALLAILPPGSLLAALLVLPTLGAAVAAALPSADRLTLRAVGVTTCTAIFAVACLATWALLDSQAVKLTLHGSLQLVLLPETAPALLTITGVTPLALRAGAPRVEKDMVAYVVAHLAMVGLTVLALLLADPIHAFAVALVAAIPAQALVALFGGPTRGTTTWRAAALWLVVDALALSVVVVGPTALTNGNMDPMGQALVALVVLGPGLTRLAAGPHGLWALPVFEVAPVAGACAAAAVVAPLGGVLLWRGALLLPSGVLTTAMPTLLILLAGAAAIGAALVVAERDLRRTVAHWLGTLGSIAGLGILVAVQSQRAPAAPLALVGLVGFSAGVCLMVIEAIERRLETRRLPGLAGLGASAPLLALMMPASLLLLAGAPGPGTAVALWPTLALLLESPVPWASTAAWLCLAAVFVGAIGVADVAGRVAVPAWRSHIQIVRVTFWQGIRVLIPVLALTIATAGAGPLMRAMEAAP